MNTKEKVIRVDSIEEFDRELARDGGEAIEVPAWMAEEYGIFPEDVGDEEDLRDDGSDTPGGEDPRRESR